MNSWQVVFTTVDYWKSSQVWMEGNPCSSEELVENVILLAVTVKETRANDVHIHHGVGFAQGKGCLFNLFQALVFWKRHTFCVVLVCVA